MVLVGSTSCLCVCVCVGGGGVRACVGACALAPLYVKCRGGEGRVYVTYVRMIISVHVYASVMWFKLIVRISVM